MKVITNDKTLAIEVLSVQNLFNEDINEIRIIGVGSPKYGLNNYDADIKIYDIEFILYRDLDFKNIDIRKMLKSDITKIEYEIINSWKIR